MGVRSRVEAEAKNGDQEDLEEDGLRKCQSSLQSGKAEQALQRRRFRRTLVGSHCTEPQGRRGLVELLSTTLSADEVLAFDRFLQERIRDAFRADLWAVAYIMNGGCSDDGFDYFLGWLICRGKKHYEAALANPEDAAKGVSPDDEPFENESVYYAPSHAWAALTGKPRDDYYKIAPSVGRSLKGELFDEDTVYDEHPKLAKKFG